MKLHWHSYLLFNIDNCAYETCTETGLIQLRLRLVLMLLFGEKLKDARVFQRQLTPEFDTIWLLLLIVSSIWFGMFICSICLQHCLGDLFYLGHWHTGPACQCLQFSFGNRSLFYAAFLPLSIPIPLYHRSRDHRCSPFVCPVVALSRSLQGAIPLSTVMLLRSPGASEVRRFALCPFVPSNLLWFWPVISGRTVESVICFGQFVFSPISPFLLATSWCGSNRPFSLLFICALHRFIPLVHNWRSIQDDMVIYLFVFPDFIFLSIFWCTGESRSESIRPLFVWFI
jgi:hypothetical protein